MSQTLAYIVFYKKKVAAIYKDREQAQWMTYLLGRPAKIRKLTDKSLKEILKKLSSRT